MVAAAAMGDEPQSWPPAYVALLPLLYMELHHRMCSPSSTQCPLVAISRDGLAFYVYLDRVNLIYLLHP